jgi:hypothetical protein
MNQTQLKALLASYGRSTLGAALALYMSGVTDFGTLSYSLLAAIAPVVIRAINPNDTAFGRMPLVEDVKAALKKVAVKKAPAKKVAKKAPAKKKPAPKK